VFEPVVVHPLAGDELKALPMNEQIAVRNAMKKLESLGAVLPFPHSSAVRDADRLRELRPRAGNSPWRAFYRQIGGVFAVGAIGPEANVKPRVFEAQVRAAEERLNDLEEASQ
jgi:hypothetical protein